MTIVNSAESLWSPITDGGTTQQIVRQLGEAIGAGLYRAGEYLPAESALADRFHVSLMTVRKALAVLRDEGYIKTHRGRGGGSFVASDIAHRVAAVGARTEFTRGSLQELTDWRCAIAGTATELAARRRQPSDLENLQRQLDIVDQCTEDAGLFRMEDARFHILIADISQSRRLLSGEVEIQDELSRIIAPVPGSRIVRHSSHGEHQDIFEAIRSGDADTARLRAVQHSEATNDWLIGLHLGTSSQPEV